MKEGEEEPFAGNNPVYQDLVNIDFPQVEEYRHKHSNWDRYHRGDFNTWFPAVEARSAAQIAGIAGQEGIILSLIVWLLSTARAALLHYYPKFGSGDVVFWLGVAGSALVQGLRTWRSIAENLRRRRSLFAREGLQPVREIDLVGRVAVQTSIPGLPWLAALVQKLFNLLRHLMGVGPRSSLLVRSYARVRAVWLGNGQFQFGCGPKGFSVTHHSGLLYLVGWEKVRAIYDNEELFDRATSIRLPSDDQAVNEKYLESLCGLTGVEWALESIRLRLEPTSKTDLPDEVVIPKRFFGDVGAETTWQEFLWFCVDYRFNANEADGSGKSAGSVKLPKASAGPNAADSLERWRQGANLASSA